MNQQSAPRDPDALLDERRKYISAFNDTMIRIWRDRIAKLSVVDTGALYNSLVKISTTHDAKIISVTMQQAFNLYGLYVDYGTGSNTPVGNPGDIGRPNRRKRRRWFSKAHYASVMNLREFFSSNLGRHAASVISDALSQEISATFGPTSSRNP